MDRLCVGRELLEVSLRFPGHKKGTVTETPGEAGRYSVSIPPTHACRYNEHWSSEVCRDARVGHIGATRTLGDERHNPVDCRENAHDVVSSQFSIYTGIGASRSIAVALSIELLPLAHCPLVHAIFSILVRAVPTPSLVRRPSCTS